MMKGCQKETNDSRDTDVGWIELCRKNDRWSFKGPLKHIRKDSALEQDD